VRVAASRKENSPLKYNNENSDERELGIPKRTAVSEKRTPTKFSYAPCDYIM
jgi:hypothetical protein